MEIDLIFKIAAIGIIVAVLNQLLIRSGREDQAMMTTLAGLWSCCPSWSNRSVCCSLPSSRCLHYECSRGCVRHCAARGTALCSSGKAGPRLCTPALPWGSAGAVGAGRDKHPDSTFRHSTPGWTS